MNGNRNVITQENSFLRAGVELKESLERVTEQDPSSASPTLTEKALFFEPTCCQDSVSISCDGIDRSLFGSKSAPQKKFPEHRFNSVVDTVDREKPLHPVYHVQGLSNIYRASDFILRARDAGFGLQKGEVPGENLYDYGTSGPTGPFLPLRHVLKDPRVSADVKVQLCAEYPFLEKYR